MISTERTTIVGYACAAAICGMMLCEDGATAMATAAACATGMAGVVGYGAGRVRKLRAG